MRTSGVARTVAIASAVLLGACGDATSPANEAGTTTAVASDGFDDSTGADEIVAAPANFDLAVGEGQRFIVGLFTSERNLVVGGEVSLDFYFLGDEVGATSEDPVASTTGTFLAVPGDEPDAGVTSPTVVPPGQASGVYEAVVDFDRPGFWGVAVEAEVDGRTVSTTTPFEVAAAHQVPDIGDPAPPVENALVGSDADPASIDSRARGDDAQVPDPGLHATTVAESLESGRPVVVVVSTPTYCVSQFCGPITETIEGLAGEYGDRADFVHLEVWQDFDDSELNAAAAEWIQTEDGGGEPWVFAVGADGVIVDRWDNVLDERALVSFLEGLTPL